MPQYRIQFTHIVEKIYEIEIGFETSQNQIEIEKFVEENKSEILDGEFSVGGIIEPIDEIGMEIIDVEFEMLCN